ncbi:MAG: hypothetical protein ACFFDN_10820 [Candidatus Hodarchaeota archaeon]
MKLPKVENISEFLAFLNIEINRQKGYIWWLMPLLVGGLYSEGLKKKIVTIFTQYWYLAIPVWIILTLFDLFILIPGEQNFYHKRSAVLKQILKNGK